MCHSKTQNLQQIVSHIEQYYKNNVSSKTQNLQQIVSHIEQYYKANMSFLDKKSTTDCKSYRTILQE